MYFICLNPPPKKQKKPKKKLKKPSVCGIGCFILVVRIWSLNAKVIGMKCSNTLLFCEIASVYMEEWSNYICLGILCNRSADMEYSPALISAMLPSICWPIINTWRHYHMSRESRVPRHTASNICDICHTPFSAWSVRYIADSKVVFSTVVSSFRPCIIRTADFSIDIWKKKRQNYHHYLPALFPRKSSWQHAINMKMICRWCYSSATCYFHSHKGNIYQRPTELYTNKPYHLRHNGTPRSLLNSDNFGLLMALHRDNNEKEIHNAWNTIITYLIFYQENETLTRMNTFKCLSQSGLKS